LTFTQENRRKYAKVEARVGRELTIPAYAA